MLLHTIGITKKIKYIPTTIKKDDSEKIQNLSLLGNKYIY